MPVGLLAAVLFVSVLSLALKFHYTLASVNELDWILFPTVRGVEAVTGIPFVKESFTGYVNWNAGVIIAKSCAGINFMVTMIIMLSVITCTSSEKKQYWGILPLICLLSYVLTIFANTIRIVISIYCFRVHPFGSWLSKGQLHRITGVIVFFTLISVTYFLFNRIHKRSTWMPDALIPLMCYAGITILLPVIRSPFLVLDKGFMAHGIIVLSVSLTILTFSLAADRIFEAVKK